MVARFQGPVPPFSGWEHGLYRLSQPVTEEDVEAILDGQEECVQSIGPYRTIGIHTFGLVEITVIVGSPEIEAWSNPEQRFWTSEYLDALLSTRF